MRLINLYDDPLQAVHGGCVGDSSNVDMSVGDIYGPGFKRHGLSSERIACSFGKLKNVENPKEKINKDDFARSLITMIVVNTIIQASLIAEIHKKRNIVTVGHHMNAHDYLQMT